MKENKSRRKFLKDVAYKAPVVFALGSLMAPVSANASNASGAFPKLSSSRSSNGHDSNANDSSNNANLDSK